MVLASKDELNLMYQQLHVGGVGGFSDGSYWSSSEDGRNEAHIQYFPGGHQTYGKEEINRVRAVRAF